MLVKEIKFLFFLHFWGKIHRIKQFKSGWDLGGCLEPLPSSGIQYYSILNRWSSRWLNTSCKGDSTPSQVSLFYCWTVLTFRKYYLMSNQNLLFCHLNQLFLVACSGTTSNNPVPCSTWDSFRSLKTAIISSQPFLL